LLYPAATMFTWNVPLEPNGATEPEHAPEMIPVAIATASDRSFFDGFLFKGSYCCGERGSGLRDDLNGRPIRRFTRAGDV
jgi:hypothetical protein